jgi:ParB family chromosome partitioning protein
VGRRSGLGRGLDALIPTDSAATTVSGAGLSELPITTIVPNRFQPRAHFDEASLTSLTESIRTLGVLQPVLVRPVDDGFELIAGERRWRAAKRAGLTTIPAVVKTTEDEGSLEQALVENLHRQDLNPLEEAAANQQLNQDFSLTQDQVAKRVGKSRSAVANTLRVFQLPPSVQKLLGEGSISLGHAKALLGTPDRAYQEMLGKMILADELTVRSVEVLIRERGELEEQLSGTDSETASDTSTNNDDSAALRPPGLLELERLLSEQLSTKVRVEMGSKRGKMQIDFADLEDLERIYRVISA